MANNSRRGGRGTNQYSVKPLSTREEDAQLRGIHSLREVGVPKRDDLNQHQNGVDANLQSIMNVIESDNASDEEKDSAQQALEQGYPELYVKALQNDQSVRDEAMDEYDADVDQLTEMIRINVEEEDDSDMSDDSARISALIVTSARDYDGRGQNLAELNDRVSDRNRSFVNSLNL